MEEISKDQLKKLLQDVSEIKDYLLGTAYNKKGLVERVENLENEMTDLNVIRWKITGAAITVATIASVVTSVIVKMIFNV